MSISLESIQIQKFIADGPLVVNAFFAKDNQVDSLDSFTQTNPNSTEFLFGEEDQIIGYKNPQVNVAFGPKSLFPFLQTSFSGKLTDALNQGKRKHDEEDVNIPITDLQGIMERYLSSSDYVGDVERNVKAKGDAEDAEEEAQEETAPVTPPTEEMSPGTPHQLEPLYADNLDEFISKCKKDNLDPQELGGIKIDSYNDFEIYKFHPEATTSQNLSPSQKALQSFFRRITLVTPLVIEDAQFIERTDDRWWLFCTFSNHALVGFVTVYTFYAHPHSIRARISQFGILPHFQRQGHGKRLYDAVMSCLKSNSLGMGISEKGEVWKEFWDMPVKDIGVELPSDSFIDIRDTSDAKSLMSLIEMQHVVTGKIPTDDQLNFIHVASKLSPRQSRRIVEMLILRGILQQGGDLQKTLNGVSKTRVQEDLKPIKVQYDSWVKWVKTRVWKMNKDVLSDMTTYERKMKLDEVVKGLTEDYMAIIKKL